MAFAPAWKGIAEATATDPDGVAAVYDVGNDLPTSRERAMTEPAIGHELAWVIECESQWHPDAVNVDTGASGLIQFMKDTAIGLGTTIGAIRKMSRAEQAPYIRKFYANNMGSRTFNRVGDVYLCTFWPDGLSRADDYVIAQPGTAVWRQNPAMRDGPVGPDPLSDGRVLTRKIGPVTVGGVRRVGTPPSFTSPGKGSGGGKVPAKGSKGAPDSPLALGANAGLALVVVLVLWSYSRKKARR